VESTGELYGEFLLEPYKRDPETILNQVQHRIKDDRVTNGLYHDLQFVIGVVEVM
jgi:hypothetical protein